MAHAHDLKIPRNVKWENISTSWRLIFLKTQFSSGVVGSLCFFTRIFFQNKSLDGDPLPLARNFLKVLFYFYQNLKLVPCFWKKSNRHTINCKKNYNIFLRYLNNRQWLRWQRVLKMEKIMTWWPFWMPGHNTER